MEHLKAGVQYKEILDNPKAEDKRRESSIYESTYVVGKIEGHKEGREEKKN